MMGKSKFTFVMPFHISEGRGGGAEVQAWLLAKELAHRGYVVSYIAQSIQNKQGQEEIIDGVTIKWVKYAHHFRWSNGFQYYKGLKKENPDFVIQRMTSFTTGVIGLYCKLNNKTFIWICTDNESPFKWFHYKKQLKINKENEVGIVKSLIFRFNSIINDLSIQFGMRFIDHAFTQNEFQRKALADSFGIESFKMISGHEKPRVFLTPEQKIDRGIVLWVSNLGPNKQPNLFIELARVAKDLKLRFVMIGSRSDQSYLENLFKKKPDNLEWLGKLTFKETLEWFDRTTFFINTSKKEGFPNTYIQAWLRGVPVISMGVDPDGIIQKYKLGYVVNDIEQMLQKIQFLMNTTEEYKLISKNAIEYANLYHSIEAMTHSFLCHLSINNNFNK
jgi:glycosyltransferase involved in cell wall biosynthesis